MDWKILTTIPKYSICVEFNEESIYKGVSKIKENKEQ